MNELNSFVEKCSKEIERETKKKEALIHENAELLSRL